MMPYQHKKTKTNTTEGDLERIYVELLFLA